MEELDDRISQLMSKYPEIKVNGKRLTDIEIFILLGAMSFAKSYCKTKGTAEKLDKLIDKFMEKGNR